MILPKYYTVSEVLDALYRQKHVAKEKVKEANSKYEEWLKPHMVKTWFGLYREVTNKADTYHGADLRRDIKFYKRSVESIEVSEKVIKKFPLTAKVSLTLEEIEDFGDTLTKRTEYKE
jgi:hypothetical protein